jgi:hypothetical protein
VDLFHVSGFLDFSDNFHSPITIITRQGGINFTHGGRTHLITSSPPPVTSHACIIFHQYKTSQLPSHTEVLPVSMSSPSVEWSCSTCNVVLETEQGTHPPCHTPTTWTCLLTQRSGTHKNFKRHSQQCEYCSPDQRQRIQSENAADKENRMQAVEEDEEGRTA